MKDATIIQEFKTVKAMIAQTNDRIQAQHRLMNSTMILLKNYNARLETIQELLIDNKIVDGAQFEQVCDAKLGLRLLGADEEIRVGDVAWCTYEAKVEDKVEAADTIPVRIGSGQIVFEQILIGKKPNTEGHTHTADFKEGEETKAIVFSVKVGKVKRRLNEGVVDEVIEAAGATAVDESGAAPELPANTNGSQDGQPSEQLHGDLQP